MPNRTIIYARVSTEDQVEKYGLPVQLRVCREYAQAHDMEVIAEIADEGISGVILERPGLQRVRAMVRAGEADTVLMVDVDRLSRELAHLLILKPELEKRARLQFVSANFEDSPSGRMFFGIRGVISQYERELTRERTMRGKRERARSGLIVGGRICYGYQYEAGKLSPDPERAPIAQQIFAWCDAGVSLREISRRLRAVNAPTWSGRKWGHSSVRRILSNETYAGVAHYGAFRREGKCLRVRTPNERIALVVPHLVERAQWDRVQARLQDNPRRNCGRPSSYLLRGVLYCACGRKMSGDSNRNYRSYRCSGRDALRFRGGPCRCAIGAAKLEAAVWRELVAAFTDADFLLATLRTHEQTVRDQDPQEAKQLEQQARKLKAREETALVLLMDPDLAADRSKIKQQYKDAQQARQRIEARLAGLQQAGEFAADGESWARETAALLREDVPGLTELADRQSFVRSVLSRADWDGEVLTLHCFLGGEMATPSGCCLHFPPCSAVQPARLEIILKTRLAA